MELNPQNNGSTSANNENGTPMGTCPPGTPPFNNGYPNPYSPNISPASIYSSSAQGNAPQYHYGMPNNVLNEQYLEEQRRKTLERRHHERKITSLGTTMGITLLVLLGISFALSYFFLIPLFSKAYNESLAFSAAFGIFYSVTSVGGAFLLGSKLLKRSGNSVEIPYNAPTDKFKAFLLVLMGLGGCLFANYITAFLRTIAEGIGIYSSYSAIENPTSTLDVVMIFIGSAVIPPLVEEFALRGVALQSLKKYGNAFAIVASAFVFGVFHGNAVQMPFAFMCGLVIGYAVLATNSLWTGVIIHALMNAMSSVSSALTFYLDEYAADTFFYAASFAGILAGVIALVIYLGKYKNDTTLQSKGILPDVPVREKFLKFIGSPVMIVAIVIFVIEAVSQLSLTPTY